MAAAWIDGIVNAFQQRGYLDMLVDAAHPWVEDGSPSMVDLSVEVAPDGSSPKKWTRLVNSGDRGAVTTAITEALEQTGGQSFKGRVTIHAADGRTRLSRFDPSFMMDVK